MKRERATYLFDGSDIATGYGIQIWVLDAVEAVLDIGPHTRRIAVEENRKSAAYQRAQIRVLLEFFRIPTEQQSSASNLFGA